MKQRNPKSALLAGYHQANERKILSQTCKKNFATRRLSQEYAFLPSVMQCSSQNVNLTAESLPGVTVSRWRTIGDSNEDAIWLGSCQATKPDARVKHASTVIQCWYLNVLQILHQLVNRRQLRHRRPITITPAYSQSSGSGQCATEFASFWWRLFIQYRKMNEYGYCSLLL